MVGVAHHVQRLIVVHHPQGKIQRVGTDVDQRAAALLLLIEEHTPVRHRPAAHRVRLGKVNLAELPVRTQLMQVLRLLAEPVLVTDGQLLAGALGCFAHRDRFRRGLGHRLLAHDVFARFQRVDGDEGVRAVRRAHMHRIHLRFLREQLLIIGVHPRIRRTVILPGLLGAFRYDVAESNHFHARQTLEAGHVLAVGNPAAAHDGNANNLFHDKIRLSSLVY